ncbi:hypothetical protein [Geomonas subterranea]|uniref:hypothetical protein n=1 Tax=Geomonas subterranea TaxID=2847989 RepID=UPI001CD6E1C0|nr:hypothetical protein [Geomonas fuzhouensis]
MLFSYGPLQNLYTAARNLIKDADAGNAIDLVDLKVAIGELEMMVFERLEHAPLVAQARKEGGEQVQVDPNPLVAVAEDGVWVEAWVYVPKEG